MDQNNNIVLVVAHLDLLWMVVAAVLVFLMQAGFAMLESGMSRTKNSINVMMKNYVDVCLVSLVFWAVGYGLMYGENPTGFFGTSLFFGGDVTNDSEFAKMLFYTVYAATAVTICSGAMAERTKYHAYVIASIFITIVVYAVYGSWVWNPEGWLARLGFLDFAGSTVIHSVGAWCALAGILIAGPRLGRFDKETREVREIRGHNLSLVALGGFILWFGWFGFNGGSIASLEDGVLGRVLLNTHLSAAGGALGVSLLALIQHKPVLLTNAVNGTLGGLVAITAGCNTIDPSFAIFIGLIGGMIVIISQSIMLRLGLDDVVGAVSVHGAAGVWGTLAAGFFIAGDLFNVAQLSIQFIGVVIAFVWAFPVALLIFFIIDRVIGVRSETLHEMRGLDYTEHNEIGYPEFHTDSTYKPASVKMDKTRARPIIPDNSTVKMP